MKSKNTSMQRAAGPLRQRHKKGGVAREVCHRNHRYPVFENAPSGQRCVSCFSISDPENFKIPAVDQFLFLPESKNRRWIGMPREEVVRRGVIRQEIPVYGMAGLAGPLAAVIARRQRDEQ
jgi:hypothetical protein